MDLFLQIAIIQIGPLAIVYGLFKFFSKLAKSSKKSGLFQFTTFFIVSFLAIVPATFLFYALMMALFYGNTTLPEGQGNATGVLAVLTLPISVIHGLFCRSFFL